MQRFFNETSIADPSWNIGNCSSTTAYLLVDGLDVPTFCICQSGWTGLTCAEHQPLGPYIRLIFTQILGGICYGLLALYTLVLVIALLIRARALSKGSWLRISSFISLLIGIVLRIVWLIDTSEPNETIRVIPRIVEGLLYWLPIAFYIFGATVIVTIWSASSLLF